MNKIIDIIHQYQAQYIPSIDLVYTTLKNELKIMHKMYSQKRTKKVLYTYFNMILNQVNLLDSLLLKSYKDLKDKENQEDNLKILSHNIEMTKLIKKKEKLQTISKYVYSILTQEDIEKLIRQIKLKDKNKVISEEIRNTTLISLHNTFLDRLHQFRRLFDENEALENIQQLMDKFYDQIVELEEDFTKLKFAEKDNELVNKYTELELACYLFKCSFKSKGYIRYIRKQDLSRQINTYEYLTNTDKADEWRNKILDVLKEPISLDILCQKLPEYSWFYIEELVNKLIEEGKIEFKYKNTIQPSPKSFENGYHIYPLQYKEYKIRQVKQ